MLTKIVLTEGEHVETPWAEALGGDRYRLANRPFWKYGVSADDIIEAVADESGRPAFVRVLEKSGNRTVRVRLQPPMDISSDSKAVVDALVLLGCDFEGLSPAYIAVNVPPNVSLEVVAQQLVESGQEWEYADPAVDESHSESSTDAHEA